MAALSENSARILELFVELPENAPASVIDNLDPERRREILQFGLRMEVIGYLVAQKMVSLAIVNDLARRRSSGFLVTGAELDAGPAGAGRAHRVPRTVRMAAGADHAGSGSASVCPRLRSFVA